jgi:hypothetical protein
MTIAERISQASAAEHGQRLRTPEAARYLGLSESTLNKLRVFGGGPPYIKANRSVIYDTRALDQWMLSRQRASTSGPITMGA